MIFQNYFIDEKQIKIYHEYNPENIYVLFDI